MERLARRGKRPDEESILLALDIESGDPVWTQNSDIFGRYLMYIGEHDMLVEGGAHDIDPRRSSGVLPGEPQTVSMRSVKDGELLWAGEELWDPWEGLSLPGLVRSEKLIGARSRQAVSLQSGERYDRREPHTGATARWGFSRSGKGCDLVNASGHFLLFRGGDASYHDLKYDSGQGHFRGFRSGCTSNLIPADGVVNALDYTRTCDCAYAHQTSLALVHMPEDPSVMFWTRGQGAFRDPEGHGLNFGAPGRRVDLAGTEQIWYDEFGTDRRFPAMVDAGEDGLAWVASSVRELESIREEITVEDLLDEEYTVRLHFCELDEDVEAGERVFDVIVGGETVIEGFDIVEEAGGALRSVVKEVRAEVEGGSLTVCLESAGGAERYPVISGLELKVK